MAYSGINKSTSHFNTKLYTGNGSDNNAITGVGFQPDMVWLKNRSTTDSHYLQDAVRTATKNLKVDATDAEETRANSLKSFNSDGFTLGTETAINGNGNNLVSWNWKANGAGSANNDGSVTSTVSANTTAGFSIVKFNVGSSGGNITVGHGLGAVPKMIIIKSLTDSYNWDVYHNHVGNGNRMILNGNNGASGSTFMSSTSPTSSVFTFKQTHYSSGADAIAYCFVEKTGFSRFGHYKGNASSDGVFVYTGFKPSWLMIKRTNSSENWHVFDIKRDPRYPTSSSYDGMATRLMANLTNSSDLSQGGFRFLSNGLKMTTSWAGGNGSGDTFIYMCFGQSLVGSNNTPCTAR